MPTVSCSVCGKVERIPTKKHKFLLSGEPYVCSADCVVQWVNETQCRNWDWKKKAVRNEKNMGKGEFRSKFEKRFYMLVREHFPGMVTYEKWAFPVGNSFYFPDFYITPNGVFLETKGIWQIGARKKFRKFREAYPSIPILVVPWILQDQF